MKSTSLTSLPESEENKLKSALRRVITRRKSKLALIVTQMESLQIELDVIKHEYYTRIGNLLLQDNELDLQIIRYKNIKSLMLEGKTYEQALAFIEGQFYDEILKEQEEKKRIEEEQKVMIAKEIPEEEEVEIKTLWKKLIRQFHPDLVSDPEEKLRRNKIMQQINQAYAQQDLSILQRILLQPQVPVQKGSTLKELEETLEETEQMIITAEKTLKEMAHSQWYRWRTEMKKAKKEGKDVFRALEDSLIDDVLKKIALARQLQDDIENLKIGVKLKE